MERGRLLFKVGWYTSKVSLSHIVTLKAHLAQIFPRSNMTGIGKKPVVCLPNSVPISIINRLTFSLLTFEITFI